MDIVRPSQAKAKLRKRLVAGALVVTGLVVLTIVLSRLKPAVPSVERSVVWIDTVKRGPMTREVRGIGTLVPEEISWVTARTLGRVERILLRPGASVEPSSIIIVLNNPDVEEAAITADLQLKAAEADLEILKVQLERDTLQAESDAANAKASYEQARLKASLNTELFKEGLVSSMDVQVSKVVAEQAETLNKIQIKRYDFQKVSVTPQLAMKQVTLDQLRAQARLRHAEADALNVRAGMTGVLQVVPVDVGAQVQAGVGLARVANPKKLKAAVQVAETQARDIQIDQIAQVDTHNGTVEGKVSRIDPSVQNGTVTVDITLSNELPRGARPDLSVDGTIQLEHLDDIIFVGRPAFGQERSTIGMFKISPDDIYASRVKVQLGRSSVNSIEIVNGLQPGDRVILSDMSQWDAHDRIKLN